MKAVIESYDLVETDTELYLTEQNKEIQKLLSKEATFGEAIKKLIEFRDDLFQQITRIAHHHYRK